ncbi:HtaA domain-containing protein [Corynebacterium auriscanis]|uniref:HtaA domain-containing protein n=1 Tax=Corynebacterium auriscanis TaxID=99807 RepID=UPI003CF51FB8
MSPSLFGSRRGTPRRMFVRTPAAVAAVSALFCAPLAATIVATPVAFAAGSCDFSWGIKQSYRQYIQGPVAKGGWGADGIGFTGDKTGANGAFKFSPQKPQVAGNTVTVPLNGVLRFNGHNYGGDDLLDMTLSDWKVRAKGNTADILVDYVSYESDMVTKTKRGKKITGDDEVIATIKLANPVNTGAKTVDLSGTTTLTPGGNRLFLAYKAGTPMDPTSGGVALDGSCGSGASSNGDSGSGSKRTLTTISGNFTGFNKEAMSILSETNDTMNALTTFMGNTQAFLDEYESFVKRGGGSNNVSGNSGSGTSATTGNAGGTDANSETGTTGTNQGASGAASRASGNTSSRSGGGASRAATAAGGASGGGASAGGAAGAGSDVKCEAVKTVESGEAAWAVKESFQSYITGSIAKGKWDLDGVSFSGGQFRFTANGGNVDTESKQGSINHGGSLHFTGHNGILDLTIANPEIQFNGGTGKLVADVRSSNVEREKRDFGRTALGELSFSSLDVSDNSVSGEANVSLTSDGSLAFAEFYEPGIQLAPISFNAELGGQGDCAGVGGTTSLDSAGGQSGGGSEAAKSAAAAKLAAQEGKSGKGANGDSSSTGYENGSDKFKIKSAAADDSDLNPTTYLLLLIAGIVVAGGSIGRLVVSNPS